jgi:hypothetical protein
MNNLTGKARALYRQNSAYAKRLWTLTESKELLQSLRELTTTFGFSVRLGELILLDGKWYVTHAGLLGLARRNSCQGIRVQPLREFCDPAAKRWVFKATVYKRPRSRGFVGYGDADPSNVSSLVLGAEMRVAETRAVNRALRKAYGIGLCSVEELGAFSLAAAPSAGRKNNSQVAPGGNGSSNGQPRLRDRLCLLIRQHQLDPALVKRYAAEFCGTEALREATREQVEAFINHLTEWATRDRDGLVSKLNSLAKTGVNQ